ncbi:hypothetical protein KIPB_000359 [Kipferlia bialata]|uniref:Uncharacterized protein n=1 Tax=Kipferlia bialata TaxID=797122 RepID=A0A9K3CN99_9EUKA|nr:hypothetical protein KIPB_000359 [Kipferlia bialata]|eukprot:g359.t1
MGVLGVFVALLVVLVYASAEVFVSDPNGILEVSENANAVAIMREALLLPTHALDRDVVARSDYLTGASRVVVLNVALKTGTQTTLMPSVIETLSGAQSLEFAHTAACQDGTNCVERPVHHQKLERELARAHNVPNTVVLVNVAAAPESVMANQIMFWTVVLLVVSMLGVSGLMWCMDSEDKSDPRSLLFNNPDQELPRRPEVEGERWETYDELE